MGICDAVDNWDDSSPEERFEQMKEWTQEFAQEWGIDPPNVVNADPPNNNAGASLSGYDPDSNTVYLSPEFFADDSKYSPEDVTGEAAHETRHAMQFQYYGEDTPYEMPRLPREADAQAFGDAVKDYARDECDPDQESAPEAPGDDGGGEWVLQDDLEEEGADDPAPRPDPRPQPPEEDPIG
jgi:hypothetical protein